MRKRRGEAIMSKGQERHGPRLDDQLKHESEAMVRSNRGSRVEDWRDPEPVADDQPVVERDLEDVESEEPREFSRRAAEHRSELAGALTRAVFPADRAKLLEHAQEQFGPDRVLRILEALPDDAVFANVEEVWEASGHAGESRSPDRDG